MVNPSTFESQTTYVPPTTSKKDDHTNAVVQEKALRSTVSRVVAGVFVALAALAIAGFIVAGVVVSPILFVGVLVGAALLTVACTKTSRFHTGFHVGHSSGYEVVTPVRSAHVGMSARGNGMHSAYSPPPTITTPGGHVLPRQRRG